MRRFNRTVTQRVGALDDRFLARDRPLAEARMLWEIGPDGCEVRSLRSRLELDSGHASRLLRSLEADGLVEVVPSAADGRVRLARLTRAGLAERAVVDARSDELARSFLEPLTTAQRDRLVAAMAEVERLLTAAMVAIRPVDPAGPDARFCIRAYFAELDRRSGTAFDPARGTSAEPHELRPPNGLFLVAYLRSEPIGCGAVKHHDGRAVGHQAAVGGGAARGLGLGRRLLGALEAEAERHGVRGVRLDTHRALTEAIALYRSSGYVEVPAFNDEPFAHHWFEKLLR